MTRKQELAQRTRQRLIEAALRITSQHGASALTLDAVAREAGVSKGGLLHHFPNKEALIEAPIQQFLADFEALVMQYYAKDSITIGRWARAYIRATFDLHAYPLETWHAMMPLIQDEALLKVIEQDTAHWRERLLNDGLERGRAMVLWQAADASWIDKIFRIGRDDDDLREAMREELLRLAGAE